MKIAIIGAGFTGLTAAYRLSKNGHDVTIFEKESYPGGLAVGYKEDVWNWSLESHYHHWFTNDYSILELAKEIDFDVIIKSPKTSVFVKKRIFPLDSPISVLKFPLMPIVDRFRMGVALAILRFNPFWKQLEKVTASNYLQKIMGTRAYDLIWKPQLINKFGDYYKEISLAWFWARIKKRTSSLAYPNGGFLNFALKLTSEIQNYKGKILFNIDVLNIESKDNVKIKYKDKTNKILNESFDKVIVTTPSFVFAKLAPSLPLAYKSNSSKLKSLGAINLIIRLKRPFFQDNTYWLSVCDTNSPLMAIVEQTNFMDKSNYNNEHIVYIGNYKPLDNEYFKMDENQLLNTFSEYLSKINPDFKENIISLRAFKAPYAQPVIFKNYSKIIPQFKTPLKNVFLTNIEQVYPWDRGTNYAVELGEKIAKIVPQ